MSTHTHTEYQSLQHVNLAYAIILQNKKRCAIFFKQACFFKKIVHIIAHFNQLLYFMEYNTHFSLFKISRHILKLMGEGLLVSSTIDSRISSFAGKRPQGKPEWNIICVIYTENMSNASQCYIPYFTPDHFRKTRILQPFTQTPGRFFASTCLKQLLSIIGAKNQNWENLKYW